MKRHYFAVLGSGLLMAAFAAGASLYNYRQSPPSDLDSVDRDPSVAQSSGNTPTPSPAIVQEAYLDLDLRSLEDVVLGRGINTIIARVEVLAIHAAQYNTLTGNSPSTPLAQLSYDDSGEWDVFSLAELSVTRMVYGPQSVTRLLVPFLGGSTMDGNQFNVEGPAINRWQVGSSVMLFAGIQEDNRATGANLPNWRIRALDRVEEINSEGTHTAIMVMNSGSCIYQDGEARCDAVAGSYPGQTLENMIDSLLLTPTPDWLATPPLPTLTPSPN